MSDRYDHTEVKQRLAFLDLMAHEGVGLRRSGANWTGRCPFHEESSASFTVHAPLFDHAHCYGCGWNGDILIFGASGTAWSFSDAVHKRWRHLCHSRLLISRKRQQAAKMPRMTEGDSTKEKPTLPRMRKMEEEELAMLAALRGLSLEGMRAAATDKRVGFCEWPQFCVDYRGLWRAVQARRLRALQRALRRDNMERKVPLHVGW